MKTASQNSKEESKQKVKYSFTNTVPQKIIRIPTYRKTYRHHLKYKSLLFHHGILYLRSQQNNQLKR